MVDTMALLNNIHNLPTTVEVGEASVELSHEGERPPGPRS